MTTMKQWELASYGRENLSLNEVVIPNPRPGELLVRVDAVSLNYRDKLMIENGMSLDVAFPFTPGSDLAGTVLKVGDGATRFRPNDRVISTFFPDWIDGELTGSARNPSASPLGGHYPGVLAEYVAFPEDWFVAAPRNLDQAGASTLTCAGLTAWGALVERGSLRPGSTVLVQGTGGVALFALQIAKAHGAEVFVTSGSAEKRDRVKALGADHAINRENWVETVYQLTDDRGIDHVMELVGGPHLAKSVEAVATLGRVSLIGLMEGYDLTAAAGHMILKSATIDGIRVGNRHSLERLVRAIEVNDIRPVIDRRYALADLPAALDHLDEGPFGKIVIELG